MTIETIRDLDSARFRRGADAGRWRLLNLAPPKAIIEIAARPLPNAPRTFTFRFDLDDYPNQAPHGQLWDTANATVLAVESWPLGPDASRVFNPGWNKGDIYLPCDRAAQEGHSEWRDQSSQHWWTAESHIVDYMDQLWNVLNGSGYEGTQDVA